MPKTPRSVKKESNTLFNYFVKSPPACSSSSSTGSGHATKLKLDFCAGDLVWATGEGRPWWPCLVFKHPIDGTIYRKENSDQVIHVQFFGKTPHRGWVRDKYVKPFNGSNCEECQEGGTYFCQDPNWAIALQQADDALKLNVTKRLELIVDLISSDEDEEEEEGKKGVKRETCQMEVDPDNENGSDENGCRADKENESPIKNSKVRSTGRPVKKRMRIVESEDDEQDDPVEDSYQPQESASSQSEKEEEEEEEDSISEEEEDDDDDDDDDSQKSKKRKRNGTLVSAKKKKSKASQGTLKERPKKTTSKQSKATGGDSKEVGNFKPRFDAQKSTKVKLSAYSASSATRESSSLSTPPAPRQEDDDDGRSFPHTTLAFLQPGNIRDANKRRPDHPDYDPRTLFLPADFLSSQTPAMRQWWILKSQHFDTIIFFKMGKFYELFHMDAVIAVNELGFLFMKGDYAHCGFPEKSYGRFSDLLVQRGHKVARVEQTETPEQMQERCRASKKATKFDKVVNREICSIQTRGTKKSSFIDGECSTKDHNFLLSISEKADGFESSYGVCFVDVMIGTFHVGQFRDDRHGSRLRTLISHFPPSQVLYERGRLSEKTKNMFTGCLGNALKEGLKPGTEFWDGAKTLKFLSESDYFVDEGDSEAGVKWPPIFKEMISEGDSLGLTPSENYSLGLSALGAVVWYLRVCLMDDELLSLRSFEKYTPVDVDPQNLPRRAGVGRQDSSASAVESKRMILDGVTLVNLDVVINSNTGTSNGTLLQKLDSCKTPFGKRLFKQWLCSPLCGIDSINDRLNAVEDVMSAKDVASEASILLSKLPDLERLLNKIHTLSSFRRSQNHPDSRAIFFEDVTYNRRKIADFLCCLDGFKSAKAIVELFQPVVASFKSNLLKKSIMLKDKGGMFPDLEGPLKFFDDSFDHGQAKSEGVIKPAKGVNGKYDKAMDDIRHYDVRLNECLEALKKLVGAKSLSFHGTAKNRYQVEVPEHLCHKVSDEYDLTSQRKGFKRYQSQEMKQLFGQLVDAEDRRDVAQKDTMRCIFEQFDKHHATWIGALNCLSVLDILMSLAAYSSQSGWSMCRPEFVPSDGRPFLEIKNGCHPCMDRSPSGNDFIPNDTLIGTFPDGSNSGRVLLLTGPNMGGKSTLMRQVGLICLMAQLGCYVPAEKCRMTPVDRIFTRLGASDHIMSGESTFFVELSETSCILKHATTDSLVLLDELGRGTATYDGNAIASAVLQELTDSIRCRTIFSTHYHSIVERFSANRDVFLGHMACMVENEDDDDPCQETITFLFKLAPGNCPKSYGFNAAKLAGISLEVIREAHAKAKEFEESTRIINLFRNLWTTRRDEPDKLKQLVGLIQGTGCQAAAAAAK